MKKINEEEIVVFPTDKSGKFAVLTVEEYKKAAQIHPKLSRKSLI